MKRQVPTLESQVRIISGIVKFLRAYHDLIEERRDRSKEIHSLMLMYGKSCYIGERSFAGRRGGRRQCFKNAYALAASDSSIIYVEGWCHTGESFPLQHAWCIDAAGMVIDPPPREAAGYFGIPFRREYVQATVQD